MRLQASYQCLFYRAGLKDLLRRGSLLAAFRQRRWRGPKNEDLGLTAKSLGYQMAGALTRKLPLKIAASALAIPLMLSGCSSLAFAPEDAPAAGPDPSYNTLIAKHLRKFEDINSFSGFEISDFRWIHSVKGWSWLTCIRFQDRGRIRTYALFIKDDDVVLGRFAVETDACAVQTYVPFAPMPDVRRPGTAGELEPLY